jgi:hypothetical protein
MSEPAPDPTKRALSPKELRTALSWLAVMITGCAVTLYSRTLGLPVFAAFVVSALVVVWRTSRERPDALGASAPPDRAGHAPVHRGGGRPVAAPPPLGAASDAQRRSVAPGAAWLRPFVPEPDSSWKAGVEDAGVPRLT